MAVRLLWVLLAGYVWMDVAMVRVWRSDVTVWAQAYRVAPTSPRATTNYAKALYAVGRDADAARILSP